MSTTTDLLLRADVPADRYVSMSNRLARAAQGLNLAEKRLVALGLSETDSVPAKNLALGANSGWKMRISAMEYAETFSVDTTTAYEQLRAAAEKLFERYVRYEVRGAKGTTIEKKFRWVSGASYMPGEGFVELNFSPEIAPHLLGLRRQFTSYKLTQAANFDSVYSWRLFELLKSWQSTGRFETSIEAFWEAMEAPASIRKDFKGLRVRVIEPALESIRAKAGIWVDWKPIRKGGRRVSALLFTFGPDPQGRLDMGEPGIADASSGEDDEIDSLD
ncbi:replication initiation protein [Variovorax sp. LT1P1]|uniref:replication initiation protein n=1 Tax=Variovorax sp. LT1P1 TaxID=3443730 RepID=UPI003F46A97C